jgi:hypothetical protein
VTLGELTDRVARLCGGDVSASFDVDASVSETSDADARGSGGSDSAAVPRPESARPTGGD